MDEHYTLEDHEFRPVIPYAMGKYGLTIRWLHEACPPGATLYNVGCGAGLFNEIAAAAGLHRRRVRARPGGVRARGRRRPRAGPS